VTAITFAPSADLAAYAELRAEVRDFIAREAPATLSHAYLGGDDREMSRKIGAMGWIGMCWPKAYGGGERTMLERYVVAEELLVARLPLGSHWIADRQAGPLLLKFGSEEQRQLILPRIVAGECRFCIGMSEPNAGSDLASVKAFAAKVEGGYVLNGNKVWTSGADQSDYMVALCRTEPQGERRHQGLSQLLIDLGAPGIRVIPIRNLLDEEDFCEVFFDDFFVPDDSVIGTPGEGWGQVSSELAFERAGPERFLSSFQLILELIDVLAGDPFPAAEEAIGRLAAHLATVRQLSCSVATMQQSGDLAAVQAALVKDVGTSLEQEICEVVRRLHVVDPDYFMGSGLARSLGELLLRAPSFTIRGGTREVLRGIIAKGCGVL
jgi:alkylation response protein AidB-like acyl-CoA dehydrogenase